MAKTSVYLPDDLAEQARAYGIPISEVAQVAVRQAVRTAQIKEMPMTDIHAVAERLRDTIRQDQEREREADLREYARGAEWAREVATAADLRYVATYDGPVADFRAPESLLHARDGARLVFVPPRPVGAADPRWAHFRAGAREVWDAVQPLLTEPDRTGGTDGR